MRRSRFVNMMVIMAVLLSFIPPQATWAGVSEAAVGLKTPAASEAPAAVNGADGMTARNDADQDLELVRHDALQAGVGYLQGVVYDAASTPDNAPLAGVWVQAQSLTTTYPVSMTSAADGTYQASLLADIYTVTALLFGYQTVTLSHVDIISGVTTSLSIPMPQAAHYQVEGYITDAATGWPLYAQINTNSPAGAVWSDPVSGYYSITLPEGLSFNLSVGAWVDGYWTAWRTIEPLTGNQTEDFGLSADLDNCNAPGYQFVGDWPATCEAQAGGLVVGVVYDANSGDPVLGARVTTDSGASTTTAATADPAVEDAFYTLFSPAGAHVFTATCEHYAPAIQFPTVVQSDTIRQDFNLAAGRPEMTPPSLQLRLDMGAVATLPLTVSNIGGEPLSFELVEKSGYFTPVLRQEGGRVEMPGLESSLQVSVLVYADDPHHYPTYPQQALYRLGYTYTLHSGGDWSGFETDLSSGGPWNVVIVANDIYNNLPYSVLAALDAYVQAGGRLIFYSYQVGNLWGNTLWATLGFTPTSTVFGWPMPSIYWWVPDHMIFDGVPEYTLLNYVSHTAYDQFVDPLSGFEALAGYTTPGPDPNQAAMVVGNHGRTVFKGFSDMPNSADLDGDTVPDGAELWVNLIEGILIGFNPDVAWLAESPVSGTLSAGSFVVVDVGFDAGVLEVNQPGDYHASLILKNDSPYGRLQIPVTMTVNAPATYGKLRGQVRGLGSCDIAPAALEEAEVVIQSAGGLSWTLETDANGVYSYWFDQAASPLTVTVVHSEHELGLASGMWITAGLTTTLDFDLRWLRPCVAVDAPALEATLDMGLSTTLLVSLSNSGAAVLNFKLGEQDRGFVPVLDSGGPDTFGYVYRDSTEAGGPAYDWVEIAPPAGGQGVTVTFSSSYLAPGQADIHGGRPVVSAGAASTGAWPGANGFAAGWPGVAFGVTLCLVIVLAAALGSKQSVYKQRWSRQAALAALSVAGALGLLEGGVLLASGAPVPGWPGAKDALLVPNNNYAWPIELPFSFNFYGNDYTSIAVATDGTLYFQNDSLGNYNRPIPDYNGTAVTTFIAHWWDDLYIWPGSIYTLDDGDRFIIEYYQVSGCCASYEPATWEIILYDNGNVLLQYQDAFMDDASRDYGSNATIGIQGTISDGLQYGYNSPVLSDELAICFAYPGNSSTCSPDVPWLFEVPISGTLPADSGPWVADVTLDAAYVDQPGVYHAALNVYSDDPVNKVVRLPVTLTVNVPASYGKLQGQVVGLGYCDAEPAALKGAEVVIQAANGLSWTLKTDANGGYSRWFDQAVSPLTVTVVYPEHEMGLSSGVWVTGGLTMTLDFDLRWLRPCVAVDAPALEATLELGLSTTFPVSLSNSGALSASFELEERDRGFEPVKLIQVVVPPSQQPEDERSEGDALPARPAGHTYTDTNRLAAGKADVLLITADYGEPSGDPLYTIFSSYPDIDVVDVWYVGSDTYYSPTIPSLADLLPYDVVVVWAGDYYLDRDAVGDVLADYVDAGGKIVIAAYNWAYQDSRAMGGRLMSDGYSPFLNISGGNYYWSAYLGSYDPDHPIMQGVMAVSDHRREVVALDPGAELVASWSDGEEFIAIKGNVVAINSYSGVYYSWSGDMGIIFHNAVNYLATSEVDWLSETPISGTLPADDYVMAYVSLDAAYVDQPGVYYAAVDVRSSDSINRRVTLPVTLTVNVPTSYGKLQGQVRGLGYCDAQPATLEEAEVLIQSAGGLSWTLETDADGRYSRWFDQAASPLTVTVVYPEYGIGLGR